MNYRSLESSNQNVIKLILIAHPKTNRTFFTYYQRGNQCFLLPMQPISYKRRTQAHHRRKLFFHIWNQKNNHKHPTFIMSITTTETCKLTTLPKQKLNEKLFRNRTRPQTSVHRRFSERYDKDQIMLMNRNNQRQKQSP